MSITNPNLGERLRNMPQELENAYRSGNVGVIRQWRDFFLAQCDWTQSVDSPLTAEQKAAWATYRQALRPSLHAQRRREVAPAFRFTQGIGLRLHVHAQERTASYRHPRRAARQASAHRHRPRTPARHLPAGQRGSDRAGREGHQQGAVGTQLPRGEGWRRSVVLPTLCLKLHATRSRGRRRGSKCCQRRSKRSWHE